MCLSQNIGRNGAFLKKEKADNRDDYRLFRVMVETCGLEPQTSCV